MLPPIASTINGGPSPLPLSHPGEGFPAPFATTATPLPFSRMGEGGAERRMRACRRSRQTPRLRLVSNNQRRSLIPALLPSGRRVPRASMAGAPELRQRTLSCKERAGRGVGRCPHEARASAAVRSAPHWSRARHLSPAPLLTGEGFPAAPAFGLSKGDVGSEIAARSLGIALLLSAAHTPTAGCA